MYLHISTYMLYTFAIYMCCVIHNRTHICNIHVLNKCVVHLYTYTTIFYMKRNNQYMIDFTKLTPVDSTLNTIVAFFTISINVLFPWRNHTYLVTSDFGPCTVVLPLFHLAMDCFFSKPAVPFSRRMCDVYHQWQRGRYHLTLCGDLPGVFDAIYLSTFDATREPSFWLLFWDHWNSLDLMDAWRWKTWDGCTASSTNLDVGDSVGCSDHQSVVTWSKTGNDHLPSGKKHTWQWRIHNDIFWFPALFVMLCFLLVARPTSRLKDTRKSVPPAAVGASGPVPLGYPLAIKNGCLGNLRKMQVIKKNIWANHL